MNLNHKNNKYNFLLTAGPLLLVLFIDGMGLGLVFPILNALIIDPSSNFFRSELTPTSQNLIFGGTVGIFMLCWFFGAAILGDLSDQIGRKKSLLICLLGAALGYLLSAIAVVLHSLSLLVVGRIIAGFTAGSQPIAQAAIVDLSSSEDKARNIGLILFAMSLGFIIGPLLGGILSDNHIVSWFSFSTPFYFAAIISLMNGLFLQFLFNESYTTKSKISLKLHRAVEIFIDAFKHEKIRKLSIIFFIFMAGWSSFYSFISMYLLKVYSFTPTQVSLFMAVMGIGFGVGNSFLLNYATRHFSLKTNVVGSLAITALLVLVMVLATNLMFVWLLIAPLSAAAALAYSILITIFSNQVDENSQGWVMGITGAIMALVFAVDAVLVGMLATLNINLPMIICIACLISSAFLMKKHFVVHET